MKERVIAFVDGFNLYHALDASVDSGQIKEGHLQACLLPSIIHLQSGKDIFSPFAA